MSGFVVDASVAVKWVLNEPHSENAAKLLADPALFAPDHWLAEAVNAVWARVHRRMLTADEARAKAAVLLHSPVRTVALPVLVPDALSLALLYGITVYDGLYLALGAVRGSPVVTDDQRLVRKLREAGLQSSSVIWVADF